MVKITSDNIYNVIDLLEKLYHHSSVFSDNAFQWIWDNDYAEYGNEKAADEWLIRYSDTITNS